MGEFPVLAVTRPQLADWTLDTLAVSSLACAWLGWSQLAGVRATSTIRFIWEARFEGFPETLVQELEIRLRDSASRAGLPVTSVRRAEPDALVVQGPSAEGVNEHLLKPLDDWIRQPPLPHLTLRLRFTAVMPTAGLCRVAVLNRAFSA